jgi:hypothetical protein
MRLFIIIFLMISGILSIAEIGCAGASAYKLGDARLQVVVSVKNGVPEEVYLVDGKELSGLTGAVWAVETSNGLLVPTSASVLPDSKDKPGLTLVGETADFNWRLDYSITGFGRITKLLTLAAKKATQINRVRMWQCASSEPPAVSRTSLQDIAAFYRSDGRGLFVSLDFPYSKITSDGNATSVEYPPYEKLKAG